MLVIGSEQLAESSELPPLFRDGRFAAELFDDPAVASRLHVEFVDGASEAAPPENDVPPENDAVTEATLAAAEKRLKAGDVQVGAAVSGRLRPAAARRFVPRSPRQVRSVGGSRACRQPQLVLQLGQGKSRIAHVQVEPH